MSIFDFGSFAGNSGNSSKSKYRKDVFAGCNSKEDEKVIRRKLRKSLKGLVTAFLQGAIDKAQFEKYYFSVYDTAKVDFSFFSTKNDAYFAKDVEKAKNKYFAAKNAENTEKKNNKK